MLSHTPDLLDIAGPRRPRGASTTHRVERHAEKASPVPRTRHTVGLVVAAAFVSVASVVVLTTLYDATPRGIAASAAVAPAVARPAPAVLDHGVIAPSTHSLSDAETVEASIAAYER